MKILSTVVAVSITASCFSASLNAQTKDIVLKPKNDKVETHACYVAATQGLDSALSFIASNEPSIMAHEPPIICNGMSIRDFADKYAENTQAQRSDKDKAEKMFKLVAENEASQLCVDAVVLGEKEARKKYGALGEPVYCNEKTLKHFVRSFANKNVIL